jgi:pimeloyl-ACP methyl ester carboxylesterase
VWDDVVTALGSRVGTVRYDLPGFGSRVDALPEPAAVTLQALVTEAAGVLAGIDGPVVVVGQSLGSQVAEALAAAHSDRVVGLLLLTPIPLTGLHLGEEAIGPLRVLGGDSAGQRVVRRHLSPALSTDQLDRLAKSGAPVHRETTTRYVDVFNDGIPAPATTSYRGPVHVIGGDADGFVDADILAAVTARFPQAHSEVVAHAGHWLHVEQPTLVATTILTIADPDTATRPAAAGWQRGFAQQSATEFADTFAEDVRLEASVLRSPLHGRHQVSTVMATASAIYESLDFTAEATNGATTYLQWHATAFGGTPIDGVTIITRDAGGRISSAAIHHRPLDVVLRFSATLRDRLVDVVPGEHFVAAPDTTAT